MKFVLGAGFGALAAGFLVAPVSAATIIESRCVSVLQADGGCAFDGNDSGPGMPAAIESAYNLTGKAGSPISLTRITKSDDANFGNFGSITGDGTLSGTWSLPGWIVEFISVKASNEFNLIKLASPGSSGSWNTLNLCTGKECKNQPDLSHLTFYGSRDGGGVVPEPATWAMLIVGFGIVGSAMRRRRTSSANVLA